MNQNLRCASGPHARRGVSGVIVVIFMAASCGFAALALDIGLLCAAKGEMQRTADAAALSSAQELLDEERLKGGAYLESVYAAVRNEAVLRAALNPVRGAAPIVDAQDVVIGYVSDTSNPDLPLSFDDPELANTVRVTVKRDAEHGGPIRLAFAALLGMSSRDMQANATAAFEDNVRGFTVNSATARCQLLPFALHVNVWQNLPTYTTGDAYASSNGAVSNGPDGLFELNLYPGGGTGQLPQGSFGTVDIGSSSNSAADIARQIVEGVNQNDMSYFGGSLMLDSSGTLDLSGDTGLSAGFKNELEAIIGEPRLLPLFSSVSGSGENCVYTIVGWAGVRIMHVKLTGQMSKKKLIIQRAVCVDETAVAGTGLGISEYAYRVPHLVR